MRMKYFKINFLMVLLALAAAIPSARAIDVTDVLTVQATGIDLTSTAFQSFSDLQSNTDAVYNGTIGRGESANNPSIQLRSANDDSGIVTAVSGGKAKAITITFNSYQTDTRTVNVYGKNTAYTSAGDLFGTSTRGTLIGTVNSKVQDKIQVSLNGEYEYIGIRSNSGAIYIDKIEILWSTPQLLDFDVVVTPADAISFGRTAPNTSLTQYVNVTNTGLIPITPTVSGLSAPFSTPYTPITIATGENAMIPVVFNPTAVGDYTGSMTVDFNTSNLDPVTINLSGGCANEVTVADGTATSGNLPVYGYWFDSEQQINQMLYPKSLLDGLNDKIVKAMTFYAPAGLTFYNGTVTFKVANVDAGTPYFDNEPFHKDADFETVKVYTMPTSKSAAQEIKEWEIVFDHDFTYTGGDLLIEVQTTEGSASGSSDLAFMGREYDDYMSYYSYLGYSGGLTETHKSFLPKVTFAVQDTDTPEPGPVLIVDKQELSITTQQPGTFNVKGERVTDYVSVAVDNNHFTVEPDIFYLDQAEDGVDVTVYYFGTSAEGETATITVSSGLAQDVTITVTGVRPEPQPELTVTPDVLDLTQANTFVVKGTNLKGNVEIDVDMQNFTVSPTTLTKEEAEAGATITVTYTGHETGGEIAVVTVKSTGATPKFVQVRGAYTFMRGDVNNDGQLKVDDVTALIDYLLDGDDSNINIDAADCNCDGDVKVDDVTALIDYLLNGSWE